MSKSKTLIISSISVALLLGISITLFWFLRNNKEEVIPEKELLNINHDQLESFYVKNASYEYSFEKSSDNSFKIKGKEDYKIDPNSIAYFISIMGKVTPEKTIKEVSKDKLSEYGLDKPRITIKLNTKDKEYVFKIGNSSPADDGYFALFNDDGNVYRVKRDINEIGSKSESYYHDLFIGTKSKIDPQNAADNSEYELKYFNISGAAVNSEIRVRKEKPGEIASGEIVLCHYFLEKPVYHNADENVILEMYTYINEITADGIIAPKYTKNDLETLNIDMENPDYIFEYDMGHGPKTLKFSSIDENGFRYVIASDSPHLYIIQDKKTTPFAYEPHKFAQSTILSELIFDFDTFILEVPNGEKHTIKLTGENENAKITFDGKNADIENFKSYYKNILGCRLLYHDMFLDSYELMFKFTGNKKNGEKVILEFFKMDDRYAYYKLNGEDKFVVDIKTIEKFIEDIPKIASGEKIHELW